MITLISSLFMFISKNPMILMILIFILSIITAVKMFMIIKSQVISLILLVVMVGGLMIMFMYMSSLFPNKKVIEFKYSHFIIFFSSVLLMFKMFPNLLSNYSNSFLMEILMNLDMCIMLMLYLLFSLFSVMFIVNIKSGPIRQYDKFQ